MARLSKKAAPKPEAAELIFRKTLQDAFIDGFADPAQFCRDFLDFEPYEGQDDFLRKWRDTVEAVFCAGNRTGKSFISGAVLLYKAFYRHYSPYYTHERTPFANYVALATSITQGQANIAYNYALRFSESKRFKPFMDGEPIKNPFPTFKLKTRLANGEPAHSYVTSRSIANGGINLLGESFSFILNDENAFTVNYKETEDTVLRMRMAEQGGSLLKISSPNGKNHFYEDFRQWWNESDPNGQKDRRYLSYRLRTIDNPWVPKDYIEEQRKRMMPELFQQNIMADFVSLSDFFSAVAINRMYNGWEFIKDDNGTFIDFVTPMRRFEKGRYVMGIDLGFKRDSTVILVADISRNPSPIVYAIELEHQPPDIVENKIVEVFNEWRPLLTCVDATGVGMTFVEDTLMRKQGWTAAQIKPFVFSLPTKLDVLSRLQGAVYRQEYCAPFNYVTRQLYEQLSFYRLDDKKIKQDWVMAFALLNYAKEEFIKNSQTNYEINNSLRGVTLSSAGHGLPVDVANEDWVYGGTIMNHLSDGGFEEVSGFGGNGIEGFGFMDEHYVIDSDTGLVVPSYVFGSQDGYI